VNRTSSLDFCYIMEHRGSARAIAGTACSQAGGYVVAQSARVGSTGARLRLAERLELRPDVAVERDVLRVRARQAAPLHALAEVRLVEVRRLHLLRPAVLVVRTRGHARDVRLAQQLRPEERWVVQRDARLGDEDKHGVRALHERSAEQVAVRERERRPRKLALHPACAKGDDVGGGHANEGLEPAPVQSSTRCRCE
jgi:hypothetical protein